MSLLRRLSLHIFALCTLYQGLRLGFYITNRSQYALVREWDLFFAFSHGLRFDLATIAVSNLGFYLISLLPCPVRFAALKARTLAILATLVNFICVGLNLADMEYYKFTGKRFTRDALALTQDLSQQLGPLASYYWYISLLLLLGLWLLYLLHRWVFREPLLETPPQAKRKLSLILGTVWIGLLLVAARGGLQAKPLIPAHAFVAASPALGVLSLNSAFSFYKSSGKESLEELNFFSEKDLFDQLDRYPDELTSPLPPAPKNVVIIVLESFGKEYIQPPDGRPSFTPFLSSLMANASSFSMSFANGRRSIDMLPSVFAGLPSWMVPPFITSPYQTNQLRGLPEILAGQGFKTSFYHGGNNGTMFFDVLAKNLGFQRYIGANEYPNEADNDGQWGIFDEPFLQFVVDDLTRQGSPFFAGIFTLSSHNPYRIPDAFQGRFPKGTLEIHESIGYADYALQKFFEKARLQSWYKDTLFVLTADHTSKSESPLYETTYGLFSVPLVFVWNDQPLPFPEPQRIAQQIDIMPTVLDLFGTKSTLMLPFGQSLWRTEARPGIVLFDGQTYSLLGPQTLIQSDLHKNTSVYNWTSDPLLTKANELTAVQAEDFQFLKAQVQFYNRGMIHNKLLDRSRSHRDP